MYIMHYILNNVQYTLYIEQCTDYTVHKTMNDKRL